MPRKRATRAQTRAKPKLDSLGDDIVNGMAPDERKMKMENFIKDFELKGDEIRQKLQEDLKHREDIIKKFYYQTLLSFSQRERRLTVAEFISNTTKTEEIVEEAKAEPETKANLRAVLDIKSKYTKSTRRIEPILEEEGAEMTVKKPRKGGREKAGGVTFNPEPTPLTSSRYITPATSRNASALGWNTPLVTPKFDPRLPITPAQKRQPLAGELVISMAGSPIEVSGSNKSNKSRTKTLQITIPEDNEDLLDFEIPDNLSNKNLEMAINHLSDLMKKKAMGKK